MARNLKLGSEKKKIYLTASALAELKAESGFLKTIKRQEIAQRIQMARELGNEQENAEFEAALDEQALVENRITALDRTIRDAAVIESQSGISSDVVIGSTVKVQIGGQTDFFTIVGRVEANPKEKKISNESPVGSVLIGAKIGEEREVKTPLAAYKVKILEIK